MTIDRVVVSAAVVLATAVALGLTAGIAAEDPNPASGEQSADAVTLKKLEQMEQRIRTLERQLKQKVRQ